MRWHSMQARSVAFWVGLSVLLFVQQANAWKVAAFGFRRCAKTFPHAVHGKVVDVEVVSRRGGNTLSQATVELVHTYGFSHKRKQLRFYFWPGTSEAYTVKHKIRVGETLLAFVSSDLRLIKHRLKAVKDPAGFFVQFSKARNRGYLYKVEPSRVPVESIPCPQTFDPG